MSSVSFIYGTTVMPNVAKGITVKPTVQIIDPKKFVNDDVKIKFAENLSSIQRKERKVAIGGKYPSVTALLGAVEEDLTKLFDWQSKKTMEMGNAGFQKYMATRSTSGRNFHKAVEILLNELQKTGSISGEACTKVLNNAEKCETHGYIKSILPFLKSLQKTDWMKIEKETKNHYYCYQGRFDAVIELGGEPTLVDWKSVSSDSYKHNTAEKSNDLKRLYGMPLQVCAYIAAVNTDPDYRTMPKITQGAVVLAYQDGRPAEPVIIKPDDSKEYYQILAEKINSFWWKILHPKKTDKDIYGNINFVFNPQANKKIDAPDDKKIDNENVSTVAVKINVSEKRSRPRESQAVFDNCVPVAKKNC